MKTKSVKMPRPPAGYRWLLPHERLKAGDRLPTITGQIEDVPPPAFGALAGQPIKAGRYVGQYVRPVERIAEGAPTTQEILGVTTGHSTMLKVNSGYSVSKIPDFIDSERGIVAVYPNIPGAAAIVLVHVGNGQIERVVEEAVKLAQSLNDFAGNNEDSRK